MCVLCKVFPPVPWSGRFRPHLITTPSSEDNSVQSQCLYPNSDHTTPPYVHSLNGISVMILMCVTLSLIGQWCASWSLVVSGLMK